MLPAQYRLADQLPDREESVQAGKLIDTKQHGANPIDVLIYAMYLDRAQRVLGDECGALHERGRHLPLRDALALGFSVSV